MSGDFLEESIEFLKQSLIDYKEKKWRFAVLHASMSVEMLLKEILLRINPGAVLENVDKPDCKTTVGMSRILPRLQAFGIKIEYSDEKLIRQIAEWRNDVAHRKLAAKEKIVQENLGAVYKFYSDFLLKHLGREIKEEFNEEYSEFKALLKVREELIEEAQDRAREAGYIDRKSPPETYGCPECWDTNDTAVIGENGKLHCFLCEEDFDFDSCSRCEALIFDSEKLVCDDCLHQVLAEK